MLSVTNTYTVGDSNPRCLFGNIPLTIVSQTKSVWGLTKQAMSPTVNSTILLSLILWLSSFSIDGNSSMNLSSKKELILWNSVYTILFLDKLIL